MAYSRSSTCASAASTTSVKFPTRLAATQPDRVSYRRVRAQREVPVVVYDEGGEARGVRCETLTHLGYTKVSILDGGLTAWRREGREIVSGVNVPSKAFGEQVHHDRNVPDLAPEELKALIDATRSNDSRRANAGRVRQVLHSRRFNVPGGDLILWADELRNKPTVIVNCAGRTRSIIGTAALRRLGLTNVRALRNGTMGWLLAGFQLETRPLRRGPAANSDSRVRALATALSIAAEEKNNVDHGRRFRSFD